MKVRRSVRPLRWVAVREVRADVPLLVCLAVLVALLTAVAAAGPGLLERLAGRALASRLEQEQQVEPGILFSARFEPADSADADAWASDLAEDLLPVTEVIANAAPDALNGGLVHDSTRVELPLLRTAAGAGEVGLGLVYASDAPGRGAYVEGRPPARRGKGVEIAVSTRTRDALKLRLGQELPLSPGALENVQATAVVVGFFTADGSGSKGADAKGAGAAGGDRLWHEVPLLAGPSRFPPRSAAGLDWEARALVAPGTVTALQAQAGAVLTVTWGMRLDLDEGTAARFAGERGQGELQRLLVRYPDDARSVFCGDIADYGGMFCEIGPHPASTLQHSTHLPDALADFGRQWRQGRAVISFALASLLVVGLLAAAVTALLAVRRSLDAHRLQRARGASATGLALARAVHTAPAVLLGLVAGIAAARSLPGPSPAYGQALLVAGLVWLLLPALTWHALRDRTARTGHGPAPHAAGRRLTAEAVVLLLAAAGVVALRTRGTAAEAGPDPLLAAVPALLGLATVAVLVRCYPLPVRILARFSARRRGVVTLIALSRAAKEAPARALALLVLVVTLAGAVFGGFVAGTLAEGRREAAGWQVGADASYLGAQRSPAVAERLAQVRGVRETVSVRQLRVDPTSATSGSRYGIASLVGIDGARLRAAAPHSPAARALDAAGLTGPRPGTDVRVLATGARAGDRLTITLHGRKMHLRVAGPLPDDVLQDPALGPVRGTTPSRERLLLADNRDLTAIGASDFEGSSLLLYGPHLDVQTLRSLVPRAGHDTAVGELRIRSEEQADAAADGMISVLRAAHTMCTALAVLLALLALVLELLLSAEARGRTTAYLRTLGLGNRATSALHLLQLLPMVVAAVAGGTALGLTLPSLLGPALDLREFTGGPAAPTPHPDLLLTAALGAGLGVLVVVAVGVETWIGRRRGLGAVLRLGRNGD
ncbi:putative ABC transport system permease protein [Streptomyces umbrinus]|uniref:ABC transport system permease protein n=1 Tax=Streptomyces umbrinus TaxID=67370 RepID=A0ABU0SH69_9ACTN|nr:FtsX-like permease family protein [Streptomyces umbrinus]MDQ1022782.1 putative ABC transport system permease protein [Streptomyces umbrinus]